MLLNRRISIIDFISTIKIDILVIVSYAVIIGLLDGYGALRQISIPLGVTSVFGSTVALLLAFRTSQAYDRWWEARIVWGSIVNDSRTLIRQMILFLDPHNDRARQLIKDATERQIVWCYALGESLRRLPFTPRVKEFIEKKDLSKMQNVPNAILLDHTTTFSEAAKEKLITDYQLVQLDSTLMRLCDAMGKSERIKTTVFPKAHSLLIHIIIYVFATLLPFGMPDDYLLVEIAITILIPIIFVAIEKTSILMQDPFENSPMDTPMTDIARTIEINLKQMTGETDVPSKPVPDKYYVL